VPRDPANASSKKWSFYAIVIAGAGLSVDYSMAMMSTQALYYSLNGPQKLFGLTFGAYDLAGMILAPLWSWWSDRSGHFKRQFTTGNMINMCGNVIYACSYVANAWWMMLLGRLLGGAGLATLGLGSG
jgi:MFS family permease